MLADNWFTCEKLIEEVLHLFRAERDKISTILTLKPVKKGRKALVINSQYDEGAKNVADEGKRKRRTRTMHLPLSISS